MTRAAVPPPVDPPAGGSGRDGKAAGGGREPLVSEHPSPREHPRAETRATVRAKGAEARPRAPRRTSEAARPAANGQKHRGAPMQALAAKTGGGRVASNGVRSPEKTAEAETTSGSGRRLVRLSGRSASAGRIIGVGLICFGLWLLLDAGQLYREAENGGADGTRRTVALAVLRPIAALSNALHLSGLVNWGDSALNREGGPGDNQGLPPIVTSPPQTGVQSRLPYGDWLTVHGGRGQRLPVAPPPFRLPPIPQPTVSDRLTILDIGDSIGEDLGFGLGDLFTGDGRVHLLQDAQIDTGLVQEGYYDWPGHLQADLNKDHPGAVIVMLGTNDDQNINLKGNVYTPLSKGWVTVYTARVKLIMEESTAAGAHVVWVGLPPMGGGNITNGFVKQVNRIFATQAKLHAGVAYVPSWSVLAGAKSQFETYLKVNGSELQVRAADGVHLDPAGWDLLAHALLKPMERAWGVNLHVAN